MNLIEKKIKTIRTVRGRSVGFRIDKVRLPNRKNSTREFLNHPGAVAVVPLISKKKILFVRQFRYPVGKVTWEIPAGKLDQRESILACAKRELEEETGYTAKRYRKILSFWPTAAFADEIIHVYVASGLKKGKPNPDHDEFVEPKIWTMRNINRAMKKGAIKDSKTLIALMAYQLKF